MHRGSSSFWNVSLGFRSTRKVENHCLKQYGRRQNLEIVGIPVQKDKNINAIVQEVANLLKVAITTSDIFTSHRLQTKNESKPSPIIVRFVSRDIRNNIDNNRQNARNG